MRVYLARWLLPIASPAIHDGAVAVEGSSIAAAGSRTDVLAAVPPGSELRDLGDAVVLPGLVNAHTHLELSWLGDDPLPRGDFIVWLRELLLRKQRADPQQIVRAAEQSIGKLRARGTVAIGDIANETWILPLLARSGLHVRAFHELYGFRGDQADSLFERAIERLAEAERDADVVGAGERLRITMTPHAPHTTSGPLLHALAGRAADSHDTVSIHLAESPFETSLLADGTGPFADFLRERDLWPAAFKPPGISPVTYLDRLGMLTPQTLAVHCVQIDHQDRTLLQSRGSTVVTCPRSNEWLGVGRAPIPQLMREGVPVALGTDSLASAEDLDLFAEMSALRRVHPELAPAAVVRMATTNGAHALGLADRLGTVEPGKLAELIVVPLAEAQDDPLESLCAEPETIHLLSEAPWQAP